MLVIAAASPRLGEAFLHRFDILVENLADASTEVRCRANSRLVAPLSLLLHKPLSLLLAGWDDEEDTALAVHLLAVADSEDEAADAAPLPKKTTEDKTRSDKLLIPGHCPRYSRVTQHFQATSRRPPPIKELMQSVFQ